MARRERTHAANTTSCVTTPLSRNWEDPLHAVVVVELPSIPAVTALLCLSIMNSNHRPSHNIEEFVMASRISIKGMLNSEALRQGGPVPAAVRAQAIRSLISPFDTRLSPQRERTWMRQWPRSYYLSNPWGDLKRLAQKPRRTSKWNFDQQGTWSKYFQDLRNRRD